MINDAPIGSFIIGDFESFVTSNSNQIDLNSSCILITPDFYIANTLDTSVFILTSDSSIGTIMAGNLEGYIPFSVTQNATALVVSTGSFSGMTCIISSDASCQSTNFLGLDTSVTSFISSTGSLYVTNVLNLNTTIISTSVYASGTQLSIVISPAFTDDGDINIPGDNYIVLNLRTKAHSTYRDGSTQPYARTGIINFGSLKTKNVSDMFILGRSKDTLDVALLNDETTKRTYTVSFKSDGQTNLRTKKIKLLKGLVGSGWAMEFIGQPDIYTEIRSLDMYINELKRHVY